MPRIPALARRRAWSGDNSARSTACLPARVNWRDRATGALWQRLTGATAPRRFRHREAGSARPSGRPCSVPRTNAAAPPHLSAAPVRSTTATAARAPRCPAWPRRRSRSRAPRLRAIGLPSPTVFPGQGRQRREEICWQLDAPRLEPFGEARPNAGRAEHPHHVPFRVDAPTLEGENVLHRDDIALHPHKLGDGYHLARPVREAAHLNDDVDRAGNLLPHRLFGQVEIRHRNHRLQTTEGIAWTIGVQGRQRAVMTGVHGLQHVDRLWTPDLADDDAIRPHAQRVDQELALRHLPLTLDVGAACLEAYHMRLPQL